MKLPYTTFQIFWSFFLRNWYLYSAKMIKHWSKCYIVTKMFYFISFYLVYIHQRILKLMYYGFNKIVKQLNCFQNGK